LLADTRGFFTSVLEGVFHVKSCVPYVCSCFVLRYLCRFYNRPHLRKSVRASTRTMPKLSEGQHGSDGAERAGHQQPSKQLRASTAASGSGMVAEMDSGHPPTSDRGSGATKPAWPRSMPAGPDMPADTTHTPAVRASPRQPRRNHPLRRDHSRSHAGPKRTLGGQAPNPRHPMNLADGGKAAPRRKHQPRRDRRPHVPQRLEQRQPRMESASLPTAKKGLAPSGPGHFTCSHM
jgi:hypothetical protein